MLKFPKPSFDDLLANYRTDAGSVHACAVIDPTQDAVNTCAARMSEALAITNELVRDRAAIGRLGDGRGNGQAYLLGRYGYGTSANTGLLCPHGIGRGAQDVGAFLKHHWGQRTLGWSARPDKHDAPPNIQGKKGLVCYIRIPTFGGQGHIDLWKGDGPVGSEYWNSSTIWFWQLD